MGDPVVSSRPQPLPTEPVRRRKEHEPWLGLAIIFGLVLLGERYPLVQWVLKAVDSGKPDLGALLKMRHQHGAA